MNSDSGNSFLLNPGSQMNLSNGNYSFMHQSQQNFQSMNQSMGQNGPFVNSANRFVQQSDLSNIGQNMTTNDSISSIPQGVNFQANATNNHGQQFLQNQPQILGNSSFLQNQNSATEWRGQLSAADRFHVINQL